MADRTPAAACEQLGCVRHPALSRREFGHGAPRLRLSIPRLVGTALAGGANFPPRTPCDAKDSASSGGRVEVVRPGGGSGSGGGFRRFGGVWEKAPILGERSKAGHFCPSSL